jgi:Flp pilus assembly pilin Flp
MLSHLGSRAAGLWRNRSGATIIEYAMLAAFIGMILVSLQQLIGSTVYGFFMSAANGL